MLVNSWLWRRMGKVKTLETSKNEEQSIKCEGEAGRLVEEEDDVKGGRGELGVACSLQKGAVALKVVVSIIYFTFIIFNFFSKTKGKLKKGKWILNFCDFWFYLKN